MRYALLETMDGDGITDLLGFLTEIALADDDNAAALAIDNIASLENDLAVTTLEHIHFNTSSEQRHLAVIHGKGEAENTTAVELLIEILDQASGQQQQISILQALGDSNQESAIQPVMSVYRSSTDPKIRDQAVRDLRRDYFLHQIG